MRFAAHGSLGLGALLLASTLGCRHRGEAWVSEPSSSSSAVVEVFVVGQPRASHTTEVVAAELTAQLQAASTTALLIWLGTDLGSAGPERSGRCPSVAQVFEEPGLAELARVTAGSSVSAWGLPGPDLWRCGLGLDPLDTERPWQQPGLAYVLRVHASGEVELASGCAGEVCELTPAHEPPLVELVLLDLSYWVFPTLLDSDATARLIAQQRSLLAAIGAQAPAPRVLISPIPIESAGSRGLGGRRQRASYRYLPEFVRAAIADGMFIGSIGALDRDLEVSADLSNAIVRADRSFIARPMFGIVSGSAGGAGHTLPTSVGESLRPDLWSEHPGFVRVRVSASEVEIYVHAWVGGRWRAARIVTPLDPQPLDPLREAPPIAPCPSCDPQQGAGDGQVFVPRDRRPR